MSLALRAYLAATHLAPLVATRHLKRRLSRGKEDPTRWTEKLGRPSAARPAGQLIWLNAVGLGEVLSLRGLIAAMADQSDAHFLVTSTTLQSAKVLEANLPPRTIHQLLPIDAPSFRRAFLDHWMPDLCVWAEQEIWPGFVTDLSNRGIPQCMVAARMTDARFRKNWQWRRSLQHLYGKMAMLTAHDQNSADNLEWLGAPPVRVTGSLKPAAPALSCDPSELARLKAATQGRFVWAVAPSHAADEAVAIAAHKRLLATKPDALLIIAPRFPEREIAIDLATAIRSRGAEPTSDHKVYLADTYGELGLLYRLADAVLIGGTHDDTEGHSPWEAAALDTAVFHGPHVQNFKPDYAALHNAEAAIRVAKPKVLAGALDRDLSALRQNATGVIAQYRAQVDALAQDLLALT